MFDALMLAVAMTADYPSDGWAEPLPVVPEILVAAEMSDSAGPPPIVLKTPTPSAPQPEAPPASKAMPAPEAPTPAPAVPRARLLMREVTRYYGPEDPPAEAVREPVQASPQTQAVTLATPQVTQGVPLVPTAAVTAVASPVVTPGPIRRGVGRVAELVSRVGQDRVYVPRAPKPARLVAPAVERVVYLTAPAPAAMVQQVYATPQAPGKGLSR